jgi:hypothetical protein
VREVFGWMEKIEDDEWGIVSGEAVCGYCTAVHADVDDHKFTILFTYESDWFHPCATGRASVARSREVEVFRP